MSPMLMRIGVAVLVIGVLLYSSAFVVVQTQQALVLQFGEIIRVIQKPGLYFKLPFVQNVIFFDRRLLDFRAAPAEFISKNRATDVEERVVIDAFVKYRITDPVLFYQAVRTEANLANRLNSIVVANMRKTLANHSLNDLLSEDRADIMRQIRDQVNRQATRGDMADREAGNTGVENTQRRGQGFGIEVVDVRIIRADLPADISQATYERMRKNFTKEAQRFRAEGEERALEIRSKADRERVELLARARKESETIRGAGDGEAARITALAFGRDPSFYHFYRSMQAYRNTLTKDDTTVVLSPDRGFLRELEQ
jgi:modulator of FtsH protease HflC